MNENDLNTTEEQYVLLKVTASSISQIGNRLPIQAIAVGSKSKILELKRNLLQKIKKRNYDPNYNLAAIKVKTKV